MLTSGPLRYDVDDHRVQGFFERTRTIFHNASTHDGFLGLSDDGPIEIWGKEMIPTRFHGTIHESRVTQTLSRWKDIESVYAFTYHGYHAEALIRRHDWFAHGDWQPYVLWWIDDNHLPIWEQACQRYDHLNRYGATAHAFTFKTCFDARGNPIEIDRTRVKQYSVHLPKAKNLQITEKATILELINTYISLWNQEEGIDLTQPLHTIWDDDSQYFAENAYAQGREALNNLITQFKRANPGLSFAFDGEVEHHHNHFRFAWTLCSPLKLEMRGMDFGEISPHNKLTKIVRFQNK